MCLFLISHHLLAADSAPTEQWQNSDLVKAGDKFVTLLGKQIQVGEKAPNFKVVDQNFSPVELKDFAGKNILISVVPSIDTGVCSLQTKRFNDEMLKLPEQLISLTISNDLPFAQKRFCSKENIDRIAVLSDSVWRNFGENYGLLIKDMGLLSRAILVINSQGVLVYKDLVANLSAHPNYSAALEALNALFTDRPAEQPDIKTEQNAVGKIAKKTNTN